MILTVDMIMQAVPETVPASMPLETLERRFLEAGFGGFPVVEGGRLVGVVSRSDVLRSLQTERSREEQLSDYYVSIGIVEEPGEMQESLDAMAARVGVRISHLTAGDAMSRNVVSIAPSASAADAARVMVKRHLHRLPVVEADELVGVVTALDLVAAVADGRLTTPAELPVSDPGADPRGSVA